MEIDGIRLAEEVGEESHAKLRIAGSFFTIST